MVPPRVDAPRYRRRVHHIDWSSPPAWIGLLIASGSLWVAFQARSHARESAKAAKCTVKLAELVEQRKRHGRALELRGRQRGLILRNTGTLDAHDVDLTAGQSTIIVQEAGYPRGATQIVRGG